MRTIQTLFTLVTALLLGTNAVAESVWDRASLGHSGSREITVYRSPSCGCCGGWIEHLEHHGFKVTDIKTDNLTSIKQSYGVPQRMASCHTAIIDDYLIEGHVPADDIKRLLRDKPPVAGLAVPQMPVGGPGMEQGMRKDPFDVYQFSGNDDYSVYQAYRNY